MARDSLGALPRKRATVGRGPEVRIVDARFVRAVLRYRDIEEDGRKVAIDELECGHLVACAREPGGRKVRAHAEECAHCMAGLP